MSKIEVSSATMTPREIVQELDRHIVGQHDAKRAVAIALRNRWRRMQLVPELRNEVMPKNILMIGPTGVGKTEISRRLAKLAGAPFIKVEATKFTEVGYVGRDVESIIRDLADAALHLAHAHRVHLQALQLRGQRRHRLGVGRLFQGQHSERGRVGPGRSGQCGRQGQRQCKRFCKRFHRQA